MPNDTGPAPIEAHREAPETCDSAPLLARLGQRVYQRALVRGDDEPITDPRGRPIGWLLDTRTAMLDGELFTDTGRALAERLRAKGIFQIAGFGYGAFPLVCSVLSADEQFKGGFIREYRKRHGRRRLIEGPLDLTLPVVLMDDILNSGRSATRAIGLLRSAGFQVAGIVTLFNFTWSSGRERLESKGFWVESLLELNLRETTGTKVHEIVKSTSGDHAGEKAD